MHEKKRQERCARRRLKKKKEENSPRVYYCSAFSVGVYPYPRKAPPDSIPAPPEPNHRSHASENRIDHRRGGGTTAAAALVSLSSLANASCDANDIVTPDGSIADNVADDAPPSASSTPGSSAPAAPA